MGRWGRGATLAVALVIALAVVLGLAGVIHLRPTKSLVVPAAWTESWKRAHVREGRDVVLAWGDLAGAHPSAAPVALRFDADRAVAQLDALYALDVHDLGVAEPDGSVARHKVVVVVDGTWSDGPGSSTSEVVVPAVGGLSAQARGATGSVVDGVGLLRVEVSALTARGHESATATTGAAPVGGSEFDPSWELARGFAEVVQGFAALDAPGRGFAADDAGTFWSASAAYLATVAAPGGIGDTADLVRSPQLHWSSPRLGDGSWLLLQYLAERDGEQLLGELWRDARAGEDPLGAYKRLTGLSQADLNRRVAEYALRTVTWDFSDRSAIAAAVGKLDPVLLADRTTPVESVEGDPGHYRVLGAFAPADYGYTLVRLTPDPGATEIHLRLRGHGDAAAGAGLSFGFVALRGGTPRYSPVTESLDQEVQLPLRAGEQELYLVVAGTPTENQPHAAADGYGDVTRYPYEFRLSGATVADDTSQPPATGGHRHPNGGGWVDDDATVDATAFVGPDAVVRGDAQVRDRARIEGRAWVEAGAVVEGDAVVRDVALVRSGARLGGTVVVGGDAVVGFTCLSGGYATFDPARTCDGRPATPDVNVAPTPFGPDELALSGVPAPAPTAEPAPSTPPVAPVPTPSPTRTPRPQSTPAPAPSSPSPTEGGVAPPEPMPASACTAVYTVTNHWTSDGQNWFQGQVVVTAGSTGVEGWAVTWTMPPGEQIANVWNARLGTSGAQVTAENMTYNGSLKERDTATFGFQGTAPGDAGQQVPAVTCSRTR